MPHQKLQFIVIQAPRFARSKRRFPSHAQLVIDEAVRNIISNPLSGAPKTGALKGVRVLKFKVGQTELLLAYQLKSKQSTIEVLDVGPHENFYRDLEKYLDAK